MESVHNVEVTMNEKIPGDPNLQTCSLDESFAFVLSMSDANNWGNYSP